MDVTNIHVKCFDLRHSISSGQPPLFLMGYENNKLSFLFKKRAVVGIEQAGDNLRIRWEGDAGEDEVVGEVRRMLRLDDDMKSVYKAIIKDKFMLSAVAELYGMRLTLTDPWETLVCFICSANNNLKRIGCMVQNLKLLFGEKVRIGGRSYSAFPTPQALAEANVKKLGDCRLGYREEFIRGAANECMGGHLLRKLSGMQYEEAVQELMEIDGVGEKIANAVLLFGYGDLLAFPIDVWVRRTMQSVYFNGRGVNDKEITNFAHKYWGCYAGYAQQYVFWHGRNKQ